MTLWAPFCILTLSYVEINWGTQRWRHSSKTRQRKAKKEEVKSFTTASSSLSMPGWYSTLFSVFLSISFRFFLPDQLWMIKPTIQDNGGVWKRKSDAHHHQLCHTCSKLQKEMSYSKQQLHHILQRAEKTPTSSHTHVLWLSLSATLRKF